MIGGVAALPRNTEVAEQFDLLADLLELEGAESFRVLAYRRAATRMRETSGSIAQLALDGRAKELQGIGKTIEEKIVQIVEQGEIEALAKRKATVPPGVVQFMRLPGLGPKTAAPHLAGARRHDARGAEAGGRGRAAAPARRARREVGGEDPQGARLPGGEPRRRPAPARRRPARRARRGRDAAGASRRRARLRGRLRSPPQGDLPRPRPDRHRDRPGRADGVLRPASLGRRRRGARRHEGDGRVERGAPLRPPRRAAGVVREPAPALHRVEGAQRRDARGRGAPRPLHLRVRRDDGRDRRGVPHRGRGRALCVPRLPADRAGAARELRRAGGGAPRRAAAARRAVAAPRRPAHAHDTGPRTGRTRSRRWSLRRRRAATSTTRSPTTRTTCERDASPRSSRRSSACASSSRSCASSPASRRTSARTARSTCRRTSSRGSTGWSLPCTRRRRTGRPSACSRRWTTRTSTASAI